jgi:hypothetical protein
MDVQHDVGVKATGGNPPVEKRTPKLSRKVRASAQLAWHDAALNVEQAAGLLQCSTAWIRRLTNEGVFTKTDGGRYRLVDLVQSYLRYRTDAERRGGKAEMTNAVLRARAREIELRTAQRERKLMETESCIEIVEELMGMFLAGLSELPAACSRDLKVRASVEAATRGLRQKIADRARQRARELEG